MLTQVMCAPLGTLNWSSYECYYIYDNGLSRHFLISEIKFKLYSLITIQIQIRRGSSITKKSMTFENSQTNIFEKLSTHTFKSL